MGAAWIETVFCNARLEWKNLSLRASANAAVVTFPLSHLVSWHNSAQKLSRFNSSLMRIID